MATNETTNISGTSASPETQDVRRTFRQLPFSRVGYYLVNGVLVLWGAVSSDALRLQAENFAWQNTAADSVVNQIQIDNTDK